MLALVLAEEKRTGRSERASGVAQAGVDDREPLEAVKRETTQAAAAPAIAESHIKDSEFGSAEATGTPTVLVRCSALLTRHKRRAAAFALSQASKAHAVTRTQTSTTLNPDSQGETLRNGEAVQDTETTTTVVGSTAAGAAIGGLALLAAGPVAGLAAAGLAGGAALRYMAGTGQVSC